MSNIRQPISEQELCPEENHTTTPPLLENIARDDLSKDESGAPVVKQQSPVPFDHNNNGIETPTSLVFETSSNSHAATPLIVKNNPKDTFPKDELIASSAKQYQIPFGKNNIFMKTPVSAINTAPETPHIKLTVAEKIINVGI